MEESEITVGILTISDSCFTGKAEDKSGPNLKELVNSKKLFNGKVVDYACVPDDVFLIKEQLLQWTDKTMHNLILTTGGTGLSKRDVTPEVIREIIEKEVPGFALQMFYQSINITPLAMLSRPVCGSRNNTLIISLPGSKKASEECLRFVSPAISHSVDLLNEKEEKVKASHLSLQEHPINQCHYVCSGSSFGKSKADVAKICGRPRKSPYPMISVESATEKVLSEAYLASSVKVLLRDSLGYVISQPVYAIDPLPPFHASIKDGYAVIASDGDGLRQVLGCSLAGAKPDEFVLTKGNCVRINTGAPVPHGADAVIQVENTELVKQSEDGLVEYEIRLLTTPVIGQDIRPIGSDIVQDQMLLGSETLLGPIELGLLASVGHIEVEVFSKPIVAIISTGNELQEPDEPLIPGHIRDSNRTTLIFLLKHYNFRVKDLGIVKDDPTQLTQALCSAFKVSDIIVTTGSVSMGERDILRSVLISDFNAQIHFAQVFMKPGKPTTFATCIFDNRKKLILGLPGNPVSATVTAHLYLIPLCKKMSGYANYNNTVIKAKLATPVMLDARPMYHRATLVYSPDEDLPVAYSTGSQSSSRLLSMSSAQVLLTLPPKSKENEKLSANTVVNAILLSRN